MLGYAENDILPNLQEWINRIHPDDQPRVAEAAQAYLNGKTALYVVEYRLRCKDGDYKWILARGMVVSRSEDGKPLRMIGTHKDISVRKQAEEALRQNQKKLQEAQRIAHVGSWQLDVMTNTCRLVGGTLPHIGFKPGVTATEIHRALRLFTPESWNRLSTAVRHTGNGIPYELELEIIRADGAHGWILSRGEAILDDKGAIIGLHGVALDITERKQMEEKARQ